MSPTQRSLAELKRRGALAQVVERYNPHARVRIDLFGVIDIVALEIGHPGVLGLQVCSAGDHATRRTKILDEPRALLWVSCGNRLVLMSWGKRGARGKRKLWTPREQAIALEDFPPSTSAKGLAAARALRDADQVQDPGDDGRERDPGRDLERQVQPTHSGPPLNRLTA